MPRAVDMRELISRHSVLNALRVGAANGQTAEGLVRRITGVSAAASGFRARRLRAAVVELRNEGHHVCATPEQGYFLAANEDELLATCRFLHSRAMKSLTQVAAMRRVSLPDLEGQLRLRI